MNDKIKNIGLAVGIISILFIFFYEEIMGLFRGDNEEVQKRLENARKAKAEKAAEKISPVKEVEDEKQAN